MFVAVAFSSGNIIPKLIGDEDILHLNRFEIDPEDGTIFTRSSLHSTKTGFVQDLIENKVEVLVYDQLVPELEKAVADAGIKLKGGVTGNSIKAAVDAACN